MRMADSALTFYLTTAYPALANISLVEPHIYGDFDSSDVDTSHPPATFTPADSNDFARKILKEVNKMNGRENGKLVKLAVYVSVQTTRNNV